jgi:hypothetical protein
MTYYIYCCVQNSLEFTKSVQFSNANNRVGIYDALISRRVKTVVEWEFQTKNEDIGKKVFI